MKTDLRVQLMAVCFLSAAATPVAHPGSGIVVNEQGEVFFVHSTCGVAKLDREGKLRALWAVKRPD
ncbi:MAG: hypothetical protein ACR2OZ_21045 [Verrucomicrobiales bacterium]